MKLKGEKEREKKRGRKGYEEREKKRGRKG
jgi:hypothetical protein